MTRPIANLSIHDERYPLPIFVFLAGLLVLVSAGALYADPELQAILPAASIGILLVLHLVLHWHSPRLANRERLSMQYALAQGGLGIALTVATGNPSVWAVIFTWLIGESIGILDKPRLSALSLSLYGVLGVAALFAVTEATTALEWLGAILPSTIFVGLVVVLYKRQVEARQQAQQLATQLEEANRQISAYAQRVEELTLMNERQRMARELHDTLSQDVAGLVLQLEAANAQLDAARNAKAQVIIQQAMARARSTLRTARAAIDDLRTRDARARLSARIDALCRRFRAESEVVCDMTIEPGIWDACLSTAQQEHIERIVSEAFANIGKHAQATHVTLDVHASADTLTLHVADNGVGFEASQVPQTGHYGLHGLRERVRLLGGTLHIRSAPGAGTTIMLQIPLAHVSTIETQNVG